MPISDPANSADNSCKVAKPEVFDGTASKTDQFIHECELNFVARGGMTDSQKIVFALSFMKSGAALARAENYTAWWAGMGYQNIDTWERFKHEEIRLAFGNINKQALAQMAIRKVKMDKGADKYITDFEVHQADTGFDGLSLIDHFKKGLNPHLRDKIMSLPIQFKPTTLGQWKAMARDYDLSYRESREYKATLESENKGKPYDKYKKKENSNPPSKSTSGSTSTVRVMSKDNKTKKKYTVPEGFIEGNCFRCNKPGHWVKKCKNPPFKPESSARVITNESEGSKKSGSDTKTQE